MERIGDLDLFLRTIEKGSISAAARSLDLSPAVGSQRIKRLERELGLSLLYRTTRKLTPTPDGLALAERSRVLIEDLRELTATLKGGATEVAGRLNVTMPQTFGSRFISPLLPEFLAKHPQLTLNVDLTDRMVDLVGAGYDLALRIGALEDSSLVARKLARNRRVLCAAPSYLAARGTPRTPEELKQHDCLLLASGGGQPNAWHFKGPRGKEMTVHVTSRMRSNHGGILRDAAVAGLGIAQHSLWHISDDLAAGRLAVVLPGFALPETGIYAVMPQRHLVPARIRAFVDYLAERLGKEPPWEQGFS
jgi:DNA-binding transcriptional LysR family regulator